MEDDAVEVARVVLLPESVVPPTFSPVIYFLTQSIDGRVEDPTDQFGAALVADEIRELAELRNARDH